VMTPQLQAADGRLLDGHAFDIAHPRPALFAITVDPSSLSDVIPHVNNVAYLHWFDRAAELHCDQLGYTRSAMLETNRMWFVSRHEIDFRAEAWSNDALYLATWIRSIERVTSRRDGMILRLDDDAVIAICSTLWAFVDLDTRRPVRVPDAMRDAFDPLLDRAATSDGATS